MRWLAALFLFITMVSASEAANVEKARRPPNIVVFLVDDLGATDVGCFGSTFYETPNVDRLATQGMRFTAAYAACPVCSPTRASMMTGRYPQRTGITDYINPLGANQPANWNRNTRLLPTKYSDHLSLDERTIAEELRDAGYATFFAGKWHLGGDGFLPTDQGFEINKGGLDWGQPKSYFSPYKNPLLPDGPRGESLTLRLADETCKFVEANRERPFFAYLSFYSVHLPLQATKEGIAKYEAKAAKLSADQPEFGRERASKWRLVQREPTYASMIEDTDRAVGKVLDKLDELKLADNTLVIFTSDNGGLATGEKCSTSNLPLRAGKGWLYEGGIRVASIVRWPGITQAGSSCATPIISNDYFPTLCEVANVKKASSNQKIDGTSIVPLLRGGEIATRSLFWCYPHYGNQGGMPGSVVRCGKWKLIEWNEGDQVELYDLVADPSENQDVAKANADVVKWLRMGLTKWREDVGAKSPMVNPRYRPG